MVAALSAGRRLRHEFETQSSRRLAGENRCPRSRADWRRGIGIGEPHPFAGQPVDVRCLVERVALATRVIPGEIVRQDEHDVLRPLGCRNRGRLRQRGGQQQDPIRWAGQSTEKKVAERLGRGGGAVHRGRLVGRHTGAPQHAGPTVSTQAGHSSGTRRDVSQVGRAVLRGGTTRRGTTPRRLSRPRAAL